MVNIKVFLLKLLINKLTKIVNRYYLITFSDILIKNNIMNYLKIYKCYVIF